MFAHMRDSDQTQLYRHGRYGLTLVELLLAIAGTAFVAAAVATMLQAAAYGTSSSKDMRSLVATNKRINSRLSAMIRSSRMVLQGQPSANWFILWHRDLDHSDTPNDNELRMVIFDQSAKRLAVLSPTDTSLINERMFTDNFQAIILSHSTNGAFDFVPWTEQMFSFSFDFDHSDPQQAQLLTCQFETQTGDMTNASIFTARLRNAKN